MCRSEPHIAHAVILMMASRGCSILGSGTSSQRISPLPCHASALKVGSHYSRCFQPNQDDGSKFISGHHLALARSETLQEPVHREDQRICSAVGAARMEMSGKAAAQFQPVRLSREARDRTHNLLRQRPSSRLLDRLGLSPRSPAANGGRGSVISQVVRPPERQAPRNTKRSWPWGQFDRQELHSGCPIRSQMENINSQADHREGQKRPMPQIHQSATDPMNSHVPHAAANN